MILANDPTPYSYAKDIPNVAMQLPLLASNYFLGLPITKLKLTQLKIIFYYKQKILLMNVLTRHVLHLAHARNCFELQ